MGICHWRKREPFAWTLPCDRAGDDYGSVKWRAADAKGKATVYLLPMGADEGEGTEEAGGQLEEQETGGRREARATARMG